MRERLLPKAMVWILVTGVLLYPALARADEPPPHTGIGPVEYAGEFPSYFRSEIEQAVANALERAEAAPIDLHANLCVQFECVRQAAKQADVNVIVISRLKKQNRDYHVEFVAHTVDDGQVVAQTTVDCSICGQQELLDAIPASLIELEAKVTQALAARATRTWPARIAVDGTPTGASLALDGNEIGSSPLTLELEAGEHQLEINALGYAVQVHRWTAVEGVEQRIEYELTPSGSAGHGFQIGGWVALSLGVVATGAGIPLVVIDGRDHLPSCASDLLDPNGACPNMYATAETGYVTLAVGVAAIAAGVGLLLHHHRRKPMSSSARVGVTVQGLSLRF